MFKWIFPIVVFVMLGLIFYRSEVELPSSNIYTQTRSVESISKARKGASVHISVGGVGNFGSGDTASMEKGSEKPVSVDNGGLNREAAGNTIVEASFDGKIWRNAWGEWSLPMSLSTQPRITSFAGKRKHPITGVTESHGGYDIADGKTNTPVYSAGKGVVTKSWWSSSFGEVVYVEHKTTDNRTFYLIYGHMAPGSRRVKVGDVVNRGQIVGIEGTTPGPPHSSGIHLHFEMRFNNMDSGYVQGDAFRDIFGMDTSNPNNVIAGTGYRLN